MTAEDWTDIFNAMVAHARELLSGGAPFATIDDLEERSSVGSRDLVELCEERSDALALAGLALYDRRCLHPIGSPPLTPAPPDDGLADFVVASDAHGDLPVPTSHVTDDEWKAIGRRIAEMRVAHGWSQARLAALVSAYETSAGAAEGDAECAPATITRYEAGSIGCSTSRLCAIAEVLGTDAATLLRGIL